MSDRTSTAWAFELGKLVAGPDRRMLSSLNAAQPGAQLQARTKLYRHLQKVHESAGSATPTAEAAAIIGALEFVGALLDAATAEHGWKNEDRTIARISLQAPPTLWSTAPTPLAAAPTARAGAPMEPSPGKPTMCGRCGTAVVWAETPDGGRWGHTVGRKSHTPEPLPV